jgi:predicted Rossmann fold flavoprotein
MRSQSETRSVDIAIIGGGAAGLVAAVVLGSQRLARSVVVLEGSLAPGLKLLLTGGGRCNLTNRSVSAADYTGSGSSLIRKVLSAFTVEQTVQFFRSVGETVHEEEDGKLFLDSNSARTLRDTLVRQITGLGFPLLAHHRVTAINRERSAFIVSTEAGAFRARKVLLATGGLSYPRTGSDGSGYHFARQLGHSIVPVTPALVPWVLDGTFHRDLAGITQAVELTVGVHGAKPRRTRGPLLWTHAGVSGPAVLHASGHWHKARLTDASPTVHANFLPGEDFASTERRFLDTASNQPRTHLRNALAGWLPSRFCDALLAELEIPGSTPLAHVSRDHRRRLLNSALAWPLPVRDSLGYDHAEVTAGGVPLAEVNPATMESRRCPGLHLAGEILDVTGRLGGFNLQWAWSSAWVAAGGLSMDNVTSPGG